MMRRVQDGIAAFLNGKTVFAPIGLEAPAWWTTKAKLILTASFLVIFSLQFNSLFNRTALDRLYLETNLGDVSVQGKDILFGYEELAVKQANIDPARIEAALTAARYEFVTKLGLREPADVVRGKSAGYPKLCLVSLVGRVLHGTDKTKEDAFVPLPILNHFRKLLTGDVSPAAGMHLVDGEEVFIGYPVIGSALDPGGMVLLSIQKGMLMEKSLESIRYPKKVMWAISLVVIAILVGTLYFSKSDTDTGENPITKKKNTIIILLCCLSQAVCSFIFIVAYEAQLLHLNKARMAQAERSLVGDLHGISGLERDEMAFALKVNAERTLGLYDAVGEIGFRMSNGIDQAHTQISEKTEPPWHSKLLESLFQITASEIAVSFKDNGHIQGSLRIRLSRNQILSKLRDVILDAVTVFVISILMFIEMLLFVGTLFQARRHEAITAIGPVEGTTDYRWMRPAAFIMLFAIDLSMSFIPLHLAKLYQPLMGFSKDLVLGLPITVEFIFVGLAIFFSGFWVDRRGWHEPFIIGLGLTAGGILYSWLAPSAIHFILSRAFVGTGYGLSLMASQGFVIKYSDWRSKASGLTDLFAGIYAGSICGGATGAMLADRHGYNFVFLIGAVMILGIIAYCFVFMKWAMHPTPAGASARRAATTKTTGFWNFLNNRIVISLIFFSSLPASIAVVGFLNYFCPIYLNSQNVTQSTIGRILMLYGVCLVYIGPVIGRYVDLSNRKKHYVFIGCLLGSLTFLMFLFAEGLMATTIAVFILSLSSSFVLSAQSAYILNLKITKAYGEGKAIGIFRSSSRIGQALGPIVFSHLVLVGNLEKGIQLFGLAYLATAIIFIVLTRKDVPYTLQEAC